MGLCAVLLTVCSKEDPAITALRQVEQTDTADRATLIAFYGATGGTHWEDRTNWHTPESIRNWKGVSTNSAGFVTELVLDDNNLSGTLPPELGDLTHLRRLVLDDNELTGSIPPELGKLNGLTMLNLNQNKLTGSIPPEFGALPLLDSCCFGTTSCPARFRSNWAACVLSEGCFWRGISYRVRCHRNSAT